MTFESPHELSTWQRLAEDAGAVLATPAWQQHLASSLQADVHFMPDDDGKDGIVVQVFRRGPFRAGYIGFPIGGTIRGAAVGQARIKRLLDSPLGKKLHILRVTESAFGPPEDVPGEPLQVPETCIVELADCRPEQMTKVKRNLASARRAGVHVSSDIDPATAHQIWETYASTIARHGGVARYGPAYFNGLVDYAGKDKRLRVLTARVNEHYVGYVILALHGTMAYYLHAGIRSDYQATRANDLLVAEAITIAAAAGMRSLNFMASPASQPGLIRFKEKWGGVTRMQTVWTIGVNPVMATLLSVAEKALRLCNRLFKQKT